MKMKSLYIYLIFFFACMTSCKIENLETENEVHKTDFSSFNYVLATEDASNNDITTFFTFNLSEVDPDVPYDLIDQDHIFINSNPSTSSGHFSLGRYFFSLTKDKKGFSSTPGLYRLTLNRSNRVFIDEELNISRDNLFPARQLCIVNKNLGYFYDEGKEAHKIQIFDPTEMSLKGSIDLEPAIRKFRPDALWADDDNNNMIRTGSLVLEENQGKLYVSVVFLELASFNHIAEDEKNFYLAVVDIQTNEVEGIIAYQGAKTVGFFVSENRGTTKDDDGNLYFCSWGWNQFYQHTPSKVFRIRSGETDFDNDWLIDIEKHFGVGRIVQSCISYNNKLYLHISHQPYTFQDSDEPGIALELGYYEVNPKNPDKIEKLNIPVSNASSRMNVFSIVDDKLMIAVPNKEKGKFNGYYAIDKSGKITKEITIENKYCPTRIYKLNDE